jgi:hypothetical protein
VRVDESIAGSATDSEILVRTLGGKVGKIGQVVHGEALLRIGESAVLFVGDAPDGTPSIAGMSQGHYPLRPDSSGTRRWPGARGCQSSWGRPAVAKLSGRSLPEARELVQKAWNASAAQDHARAAVRFKARSLTAARPPAAGRVRLRSGLHHLSRGRQVSLLAARLRVFHGTTPVRASDTTRRPPNRS